MALDSSVWETESYPGYHSSFLGKWSTLYKAMKINIWCIIFYIKYFLKLRLLIANEQESQSSIVCLFVSNYRQLFGSRGFQWKIQNLVSSLVTWRHCTHTAQVAYVLSLVRNGAASGKHKLKCWIKILQGLPIFRMSWMKASSTNPLLCTKMRAIGISSTDLDLQFMLSFSFCNV